MPRTEKLALRLAISKSVPVAAGRTLAMASPVRLRTLQAGPVLDERLELRELHLIAGGVGAQRAALEIVDGVLVVGGGVDAGRAGDREGGDVDGLGRHGDVSGEAVEALLFDGSVDDREIGAAGGLPMVPAMWASAVRAPVTGTSDLAGEREQRRRRRRCGRCRQREEARSFRASSCAAPRWRRSSPGSARHG